MRVSSHQGTSISASQRRRLELQNQYKPAPLGPHINAMIEQSELEAARAKEQGTTWENPNKYSHDYTAKGTPFVGDVSGY